MSQQESVDNSSPDADNGDETDGQEQQPSEHGGPKGKEPTRYGDWEKNGRCIDF